MLLSPVGHKQGIDIDWSLFNKYLKTPHRSYSLQKFKAKNIWETSSKLAFGKFKKLDDFKILQVKDKVWVTCDEKWNGGWNNIFFFTFYNELFEYQ